MWGRTATDLAAGIRAREFSAREVMESHLERIAAVNPRVNAIVTLDPELALRLADEADRSEPRGVLHGLPIAVKDLEDDRGDAHDLGARRCTPSTCPTHDSLLVERLRAAGALIIGKTNTPEFGAGSQTFNEVFGATRNPWDLTQDAGRLERRRRGRRRGGDAAVRRRLGPRRERAQPGRVLQPRRPAPDAGADSDAPARRSLGPVRRPRADRAHARRTPRCCSRRWPGPTRAIRSRSRSAFTRELRAGHRRADRLEPRPRRPADRPRGDRRAGVAAGDAQRPRLRRRGRRAGLRAAPTSASRSCAGSASPARSAAIVDEVKPTLAENTRFGLSLGADRIARALELRGELFTRMREFLERLRRARRARSRGAAVRRRDRVPDARSRACRWAPTSSGSGRAAGSRSPRTPRWRSRPGSRAAGLPIGLQLVGRHRGELALLRLAHAINGATGLPDRTPPL